MKRKLAEAIGGALGAAAMLTFALGLVGPLWDAELSYPTCLLLVPAAAVELAGSLWIARRLERAS